MLVVKTIKKGIKCILEWKHWKTALETTVAISTIASLLVVFWTLQEMQIQRDRAYSPCIVIEDKQVHIEWSGNTSDDVEKGPLDKNPLVKDGDDVNSLTISVNARNIGVGVAKKICVNINLENVLFEMVEALNKNILKDKIKYKIYKDGGILCFYNGTKSISSIDKTYTDKLYLLPNAEESFSIVIPPLLISIVKEFYVQGVEELLKNYPLTLNVSYQDIQGKELQSEIKLVCEPLLITYETDGSGYATYLIKSK